MRKLLIGVTVCLTAGTFVAAERLNSSTANIAALEQQAAVQSSLDAQRKDIEGTFAAELASLNAAKSAATTQVNTLSASLETLTTERDELATLLDTAQQEKAANAQMLGDLEAAKASLMEEIDQRQAALSQKDAELDAFREEIDTLKANAAMIPAEAPDDSELSLKIAALSADLDARDATIAALEQAMESASSEANVAEGAVPAAVGEEDLERLKAEIDALTEDAAEQSSVADARIAALTETLSTRDAAIAALQAERDAATAAAEAITATATDEDAAAQAEALQAQLAALTATVAEQGDVIANLRMGFDSEPASAMEMAEACIARANKIFELSQINFATGTSSISTDSVTALDHLRDLAIGCESEDMFIEIGGHTDSYGAESDNQVLSEARARSVKDFLVGRGIDDTSMVAVGFGEAQPIATNDTAEGRAQNRRITFTWKMRDDETATEDATSTEDGQEPS